MWPAIGPNALTEHPPGLHAHGAPAHDREVVGDAPSLKPAVGSPRRGSALPGSSMSYLLCSKSNRPGSRASGRQDPLSRGRTPSRSPRPGEGREGNQNPTGGPSLGGLDFSLPRAEDSERGPGRRTGAWL